MRYFIARKIAEKPKLIFDLIAETEKEYEALNADPLDSIITEDEKNLISYDYGICAKSIDPGTGALVDRDSAEISAAQTAYNTAEKERNVSAKLQEMKELEAEIAMRTRMGEDTASLESDFSDKKAEYDALLSG